MYLTKRLHQELARKMHLIIVTDVAPNVTLKVGMRDASMADVIVDAKGLSCPFPVLKARKALRQLPMGGTVEVLATDPTSLNDIPDFCRANGHELLDSNPLNDAFRFVIKKGEVNI